MMMAMMTILNTFSCRLMLMTMRWEFHERRQHRSAVTTAFTSTTSNNNNNDHKRYTNNNNGHHANFTQLRYGNEPSPVFCVSLLRPASLSPSRLHCICSHSIPNTRCARCSSSFPRMTTSVQDRYCTKQFFEQHNCQERCGQCAALEAPPISRRVMVEQEKNNIRAFGWAKKVLFGSWRNTGQTCTRVCLQTIILGILFSLC